MLRSRPRCQENSHFLPTSGCSLTSDPSSVTLQATLGNQPGGGGSGSVVRLVVVGEDKATQSDVTPLGRLVAPANETSSERRTDFSDVLDVVLGRRAGRTENRGSARLQFKASALPSPTGRTNNWMRHTLSTVNQTKKKQTKNCQRTSGTCDFSLQMNMWFKFSCHFFSL